MEFSFKAITQENKEEILHLTVAKGQEHFIETTSQCLEEAEQITCWNPIGIYKEDCLIGFAMYGFWKEEPPAGRVWLDRFLIDVNYQGKGYGTIVFPLLIEHIKKVYHCQTIYLSVIEENQTAVSLYKRNGFQFNGELDIHGEKVMVLN